MTWAWQILKNEDEHPPRIGSEVLVERPRDFSWLPALQFARKSPDHQKKWGYSLEFMPDKKAWYTLDAGPTLHTMLSEHEDHGRHHHLVCQNTHILAELVRVEEYLATFKVVASAHKDIVSMFYEFFVRVEGGFSSEAFMPRAIHAASHWFHKHSTLFNTRRGGHNLRVAYTGESAQLDRLIAWTEELFAKLPSGSGFDSNWSLEFFEEHIEATTEYSPMNGETGQYEEDIELRYDLRYYSYHGWQIQDLNEFADDPDGHYEYCATAVQEALNG